jgi:hypothetical protein
MFPSPSELSEGSKPSNTESQSDSASSTSGSSSSSSSSSSTSANSAPTPWIVLTRSGTSQSDFKDLVDSMGNPSDGKQISYDFMDYQVYIATLSNEVAQNISSNPIVVSVDENSSPSPGDQETITPFTGQNPSRRVRRHAIRNAAHRRQLNRGATPTKLDRRATPTTLTFTPTLTTGPGSLTDLFQQVGSPKNLKMVSDYTLGHDPPEYTFDSSLGGGVFIYILDTGINANHMVSCLRRGRLKENY